MLVGALADKMEKDFAKYMPQLHEVLLNALRNYEDAQVRCDQSSQNPQGCFVEGRILMAVLSSPLLLTRYAKWRLVPWVIYAVHWRRA